MFLCDVATYIHSQINGTFDDIFNKLTELVDILEYPNNGSITQVSISDAKLMIEDVGACPEMLEAFLAEDAKANTSPARWMDPADHEVGQKRSEFMKTVLIDSRCIPRYEFKLPSDLEDLKNDVNCTPSQLIHAMRDVLGEENIVRLKNGSYIVKVATDEILYKYVLAGKTAERSVPRSHKTKFFNAMAHTGAFGPVKS